MAEHDLETVYGRIGSRRAEQGVPLPVLIWALMLTQEHLGDVLEREEIRCSIDLFGELELLRSLDQFFRPSHLSRRGRLPARAHRCGRPLERRFWAARKPPTNASSCPPLWLASV